jgi:MSHA biogenesis protein MshP
MQKLFFPDASTRQQVDQRCVVNDVNTLPINRTFNKGTANDVPGLNSCSISVSCSCSFADDTSCSPITASNYTSTAGAKRLISFYKITSVATCGSGTLKSVRTIDVGSFMKQE